MVKILAFDFLNYTKASNLDVEALGGIELFSTHPVFDVWPDQMRIQLRSKGKPQDYFPVGPLRLVSRQLMNVCREFDVEAEFLPVQLITKDGTESDEDFYFCHLLDSVDCFNSEKSKCTYRDAEETWIDELSELVIDEERASGHHLFRVDVPAFIIAASYEFAKAVHNRKLRGAVFLEPKEWSVSS